MRAAIIGATSALAGERDAIDGCIDQSRKVGGPDARVRPESAAPREGIAKRSLGDGRKACLPDSAHEHLPLISGRRLQ